MRVGVVGERRLIEPGLELRGADELQQHRLRGGIEDVELLDVCIPSPLLVAGHHPLRIFALRFGADVMGVGGKELHVLVGPLRLGDGLELPFPIPLHLRGFSRKAEKIAGRGDRLLSKGSGGDREKDRESGETAQVILLRGEFGNGHA